MPHTKWIYCRTADELGFKSYEVQHVLEATFLHKIVISVNICMYICSMECNDNSEITTLITQIDIQPGLLRCHLGKVNFREMHEGKNSDVSCGKRDDACWDRQFSQSYLNDKA